MLGFGLDWVPRRARRVRQRREVIYGGLEIFKGQHRLVPRYDTL